MELKPLFQDIADAIREKEGTADAIKAADFPARIRGLQAGGTNGANVFGVVWNYADPSPALARLTPESDPWRLVTKTVDYEPVAAVGTGLGSSPFDSFLPWSGMAECNIVDGSVRWKGTAGFSRTEYDTMVFLPEFWYQCVDDPAASKRYWYVADRAAGGMERHPGSGRYVGRYETGNTASSKSGLAPSYYTSLADFRTAAKKKGAGWRLCDYKAFCAAALLALVEFATWDLGNAIGPGYVSGGYGKTGMTDSMVYHTGAAGPGTAYSMQYRGIENLYGNLWKVVDGVLCDGAKIYISEDPDAYGETVDGYVDTGLNTPVSSSYVSKLWFDARWKWAFFPQAAGAGLTSYTTDSFYYTGSGTKLYIVGDIYHGYGSGIAAVANYYGAAAGNSQTGARLLFQNP